MTRSKGRHWLVGALVGCMVGCAAPPAPKISTTTAALEKEEDDGPPCDPEEEDCAEDPGGGGGGDGGGDAPGDPGGTITETPPYDCGQYGCKCVDYSWSHANCDKMQEEVCPGPDALVCGPDGGPNGNPATRACSCNP